MFTDRKDAGFQLAEKILATPLITQTDRSRLLVLSIPRGGVVVGAAVAKALNCDHHVIIVKKIGFPGHEEMAVGAVAEDSLADINYPLLVRYDLSEADIQSQVLETTARVKQGIQLFRHGQSLDLTDRLAILVDDGIATGETMQAAIRWIKSRPEHCKAQGLIVGVPVCSVGAVHKLARWVDAFVYVLAPRQFVAVGQFYHHFDQVSDEQVLEILRNKKAAFWS
jgi:predicted phosphoribosyltransferase